jgi:hypothetical protein
MEGVMTDRHFKIVLCPSLFFFLVVTTALPCSALQKNNFSTNQTLKPKLFINSKSNQVFLDSKYNSLCPEEYLRQYNSSNLIPIIKNYSPQSPPHIFLNKIFLNANFGFNENRGLITVENIGEVKPCKALPNNWNENYGKFILNSYFLKDNNLPKQNDRVFPHLKWIISNEKINIHTRIKSQQTFQQTIDGVPILGALAYVDFKSSGSIKKIYASPISLRQYKSLWKIVENQKPLSRKAAESYVQKNFLKEVGLDIDFFDIETYLSKEYFLFIFGEFYRIWLFSVNIKTNLDSPDNIKKNSDVNNYQIMLHSDEKRRENLFLNVSKMPPFGSSLERNSCSGKEKEYLKNHQEIFHFCAEAKGWNKWEGGKYAPFEAMVLSYCVGEMDCYLERKDPIYLLLRVPIDPAKKLWTNVNMDLKIPILTKNSRNRIKSNQEKGFLDDKAPLKTMVEAYYWLSKIRDFFANYKPPRCLFRYNKNGEAECDDLRLVQENTGRPAQFNKHWGSGNWKGKPVFAFGYFEKEKIRRSFISPTSDPVIVSHEFVHALMSNNKNINPIKNCRLAIEWRSLEESLADTIGLLIATQITNKEEYETLNSNIFKIGEYGGYHSIDLPRNIKNKTSYASFISEDRLCSRNKNNEMDIAIYKNSKILSYANYLIIKEGLKIYIAIHSQVSPEKDKTALEKEGFNWLLKFYLGAMDKARCNVGASLTTGKGDCVNFCSFGNILLKASEDIALSKELAGFIKTSWGKVFPACKLQ